MWVTAHRSGISRLKSTVCGSQPTYLDMMPKGCYLVGCNKQGIGMLKPTLITDASILAAAIKEQRKSRKSTQQDLADMHDISRYTVVDAESGNGDPKLSTVLTLLNGLGISLMAVPTRMAVQVELLDVPEPEEEDLQPGIDDWDFDVEADR